MLLEQLNRFLSPIKKSIAVMISKAVVSSVKDVEGKLQILQLDLGNDQVATKVQRLQSFGFSSNPKKGAQVITLSINGNRDHIIAVVVDDLRFRPAVDPGDSIQYNESGVKSHCNGGNLDLKKNRDLVDTDGLVTGLSIDPATGIPFSLLPGPNANGKNISLVVRGEL